MLTLLYMSPQFRALQHSASNTMLLNNPPQYYYWAWTMWPRPILPMATSPLITTTPTQLNTADHSWELDIVLDRECENTALHPAAGCWLCCLYELVWMCPISWPVAGPCFAPHHPHSVTLLANSRSSSLGINDDESLPSLALSPLTLLMQGDNAMDRMSTRTQKCTYATHSWLLTESVAVVLPKILLSSLTIFAAGCSTNSPQILHPISKVQWSESVHCL